MSRLKLILLSVLAVLAVGAVASASASALHWYYCQKVGAGNGKYKDPFCTTAETGGPYELKLLPENVLLAVTGEGTTKFVLKTKVSGITLELENPGNEVTSSGWIENSLLANGELQGLDLSTTEFKNVKVAQPAGESCTASVAPATAKTLLVTESGTVYDEFKEDPAGNPFAKVTIANCTGGGSGLDGTYNVTGEAFGKTINATSVLEFAKGAPNNQLKFGGNAAEFTGSSRQLMKGTTEAIEAL